MFQGAVDATFVAFGIDAVYTPAGGEPVPVRVIARRPDAIVGFGETRIHADTAIFEVRASEVANPRSDDQLLVDGRTFVIQSEPERRERDAGSAGRSAALRTIPSRRRRAGLVAEARLPRPPAAAPLPTAPRKTDEKEAATYAALSCAGHLLTPPPAVDLECLRAGKCGTGLWSIRPWFAAIARQLRSACPMGGDHLIWDVGPLEVE